MKCLYLLPTLLCFAASCAENPVVDPPKPGGQSGDDGDVKQPGTVTPGLPPSPCTTEQTDLGAEDATAFGASAVELLARVAPTATSPFFWVPYDALDVGGFAPGPGQTSLTLQIALRAGESVQQLISTPLPNTSVEACPPTTVTVPVHVELSTADGALAASFDAPLAFGAAGAASLLSDVGTESLTGGLSFNQVGEGASDWEFLGLTLNLQLWPGGSRGNILPKLSRRGPPQPPPNSSLPMNGPSDHFAVPVAAVPDHWSSIAVWPRRETCTSVGSAFAATDPIIGSSVVDAVAAFNARAARTLEASDGQVPVRFTLDAPSGLVCADVTRSGLKFRVPGHLDAVSSEASSALGQLAIRANYDLIAQTNLDGTAFDLLRWTGVGVGEARAELIANTGLGADFPAEYEQFWWTWYGTDTRDPATSAWSTQGKLSVSSLNPQQAAKFASQVANGGPGAGYSTGSDGSIGLPGDTLLSADVAQ
jgi:hypothetical protein